jgi:hypothetical protein
MTVAQLCGHFEQRELAKETVGAVNSPSIQWIIPDWGALRSVCQRGSHHTVKKVLR